MAKKMSFEDKAKKQKKTSTCKVCGSSIQYLRLVKSVKNPVTDSWRFSDRNVGVCKCNQAEVYK
jgi:hypothetical protein